MLPTCTRCHSVWPGRAAGGSTRTSTRTRRGQCAGLLYPCRGRAGPVAGGAGLALRRGTPAARACASQEPGRDRAGDAAQRARRRLLPGRFGPRGRLGRPGQVSPVCPPPGPAGLPGPPGTASPAGPPGRGRRNPTCRPSASSPRPGRLANGASPAPSPTAARQPTTTSGAANGSWPGRAPALPGVPGRAGSRGSGSDARKRVRNINRSGFTLPTHPGTTPETPTAESTCQESERVVV